MMAKVVDARGLPCPQPVIATRNALRESEAVTVILDDEIARQNVTRMAERAGYRVETSTRDDGIYLQIYKEGAAPEPVSAPEAAPSAGGPLVLLVASECIGRGDDELGRILARSFFHALCEAEPLPERIFFLNSGVKLAVEGSPVLDDLRALSERGVTLLACGTCLEFYGLKEKLAVGEITNMYAIAEALMGAGKVVRL